MIPRCSVLTMSLAISALEFVGWIGVDPLRSAAVAKSARASGAYASASTPALIAPRRQAFATSATRFLKPSRAPDAVARSSPRQA
jgi:hypothetical protein